MTSSTEQYTWKEIQNQDFEGHDLPELLAQLPADRLEKAFRNMEDTSFQDLALTITDKLDSE